MAAGSSPRESHPLHSSCSPTHCLRRSERSDFDGKGVSACQYVMARKQLRLHCGGVEIAPLFREKHRGAPAVQLDTDSNVYAARDTCTNSQKK